MHYNRSSSSSPSFLPSLCSLQTFIGLAIILCVYFTLEGSISLHEKSLPSQQIKNVAFHTSVLSAPKIEFEEPQFVDQPPFFSYISKEESNEETKEETLPPHLLYAPNNEANLMPSPVDSNAQEEIIGGLAEDFEITWGDGRGKFHDNGSLLTISLDKYSGSGFQSKNEYLFAKIEMQIKLIPDNSAGTVTTFYLSSNGLAHDEIDFEFLGNLTGMPYTIHTNVYCEGKGHREQQFYLWFDPTADFHTYSILWTPLRIVFFVDGIPIREFKNMESLGVPFPKRQPMRIYSSLWNADDWATQGGRVHTDWSKAPFVASYRNFNAEACVWSSGSSSCGSDPQPSVSENAWLMEKLDAKSLEKMRWVQENYMTYDYCKDTWRFHDGLPKECNFRKSARSKLGQPPI